MIMKQIYYFYETHVVVYDREKKVHTPSIY